jgi:hypothetical protein
MPLGSTYALVVLYDNNAVIGFPFEETDNGYFLKTCLTANEMHALDLELPPRILNLHYGDSFTRPLIRNWETLPWAMRLYKAWETKALPSMMLAKEHKQLSWFRIASHVKDSVLKQGFGPEARITFMDHIPGPSVMESKPGQREAQYDEMAVLKKMMPEVDWEANDGPGRVTRKIHFPDS